MEEIKLYIDNIGINFCDNYLTFNDYNNKQQHCHDIKKLFDLIDKKYYDVIEIINLNDIHISGNLFEELYKFKNLKEVSFDNYKDYRKYEIFRLEFIYNNNIKFKLYDDYVSFATVFEFYKRHQDDTYYKHDLFNAGLNEVDFYKIKYLERICDGDFNFSENKNVCEMIKFLYDDFHKDENGLLIFKNKFDVVTLL
jgi:hypothetical protein